MRKQFIKSLSTGIIGLALISGCQATKKESANRCSSNGCKSKKEAAHKCSSNGCASEKKAAHKCSSNSCSSK